MITMHYQQLLATITQPHNHHTLVKVECDGDRVIFHYHPHDTHDTPEDTNHDHPPTP